MTCVYFLGVNLHTHWRPAAGGSIITFCLILNLPREKARTANLSCTVKILTRILASICGGDDDENAECSSLTPQMKNSTCKVSCSDMGHETYVVSVWPTGIGAWYHSLRSRLLRSFGKYYSSSLILDTSNEKLISFPSPH